MKNKLIDKIISFDKLVGIVALVLAFVAAFFSVYGIATLFSGAFITVAIMAGSLEIAKLVTTVYIYRYWKKTKLWLSTYFVMALIILMSVTSAGIFGYLSNAYQQSSMQYSSHKAQIELIAKTKEYEQDKISQAQNRIDLLNQTRKAQEARMSESLTNSFISRNAIQLKQLNDQTSEMIKQTEADIKVEQEKIDVAIEEIKKIDQSVNDMTFSDKNRDIRTFEFVAKLFNTDLDTVAKYFIFLFIIVFDPLALALMIAYNVISYRGEEKQKEFIEMEPEPELSESFKKKIS